MFPNPNDSPPIGAQCCAYLFIPLPVASEFWNPVELILLWRARTTRARMPEAPVDKDSYPRGAEDEVRAPRKILMPSPSRNSRSFQQRDKSQLCAGIPARSNRAHDFGAGFGGKSHYLLSFDPDEIDARWAVRGFNLKSDVLYHVIPRGSMFVSDCLICSKQRYVGGKHRSWIS